MSTSDPLELQLLSTLKAKAAVKSLGAAGNSESALQGGYGVVFPCQD